MACKPNNYGWLHAPNQGYVTAQEGAALDKRIAKVAAQAASNTQAIKLLGNKQQCSGYTYDDIYKHGFVYQGKVS